MTDAGPRPRLILVTAPNADVAASIARALVEDRLAACVNILPGVRSIYHWQGAIQDESEVLMIVKTGADLLEELSERVKELHPYEVPEILVFQIDGGSDDYMKWLISELKTAPGG